MGKNHKIVLTKPYPIDQNEESDKEDKEAFKAWMRFDEIARCYILASMNNVLQQEHSHIEIAKSMINNLVDIFGDQTRQEKQATIRKLINYRIRPETPVRVHMLEVITLLNDMEIMRELIDEETQVDMVLRHSLIYLLPSSSTIQ